MKRLSVTLSLSSGPGVVSAIPFGVPGLVLHGEILGRDQTGRVRQSRHTHVITHLASGSTVGRRWLPGVVSLADTARLAHALYSPLDWTRPAQAIVADPRCHAAVREFEYGTKEGDTP